MIYSIDFKNIAFRDSESFTFIYRASNPGDLWLMPILHQNDLIRDASE